MADADSPDTLRPDQEVALADAAFGGFWRRVAAALIDGAILAPAVLVLIAVIILTIGYDPELWSVPNVVYLVLNTAMVWLYYAGQEGGMRQATLGKRLMGLRVTDLEGEAISFARASLRHFAKIVSLAPLMAGFLAVAFTARRQGFHDSIAGCLVLRAAGPTGEGEG